MTLLLASPNISRTISSLRDNADRLRLRRGCGLAAVEIGRMEEEEEEEEEEEKEKET